MTIFTVINNVHIFTYIQCEGGQYYFRFGSIHANLLGLEVVLPNGTVLDLMSSNRKDNTGYDLKHLFIGAEGTLGVVTKVAISCPKLLKARNAAFLACESFDAVQSTLTLAKEELGEILAAFEFMDREVLEQVQDKKTIPLSKIDEGTGEVTNYQFCLLVETQGSNHEHDIAKMESFLEKCMGGDVVNGVLAQDLSQVNIFGSIFERGCALYCCVSFLKCLHQYLSVLKSYWQVHGM